MISDVEEKVAAAYDQLARVYSASNDGAVPDDLVPLATKLTRYVGKSGHILDVGCGTGRDLSWFEEHGIVGTGLDRSGGMLQIARSRVKAPLVAGDMRQIGLRSGTFDGAWCCASLLHLPKDDLRLALQEIRRALKHDGMVIVTVQEGTDEQWESGYGSDVQRFFARYQLEEMRQFLLQAGLTIVENDRSAQINRVWLKFVCLSGTPAARITVR